MYEHYQLSDFPIVAVRTFYPGGIVMNNLLPITWRSEEEYYKSKKTIRCKHSLVEVTFNKYFIGTTSIYHEIVRGN